MNIERELAKAKFENKVLKYVALRKKTIKEVYLKFKNEENAEIFLDEAILNAKSLGYLDDQKYTRLFIEDYLNLKTNSIFEIKSKLLQKGVSKIIVENMVKEYEEQLNTYEYESILKIFNKRRRDDIKKVVDYLYRKGYKSVNIKNAKADYEYNKSKEEEDE